MFISAFFPALGKGAGPIRDALAVAALCSELPDPDRGMFSWYDRSFQQEILTVDSFRVCLKGVEAGDATLDSGEIAVFLHIRKSVFEQ